MQRLKMRPGLLAVERVGKPEKSKDASFGFIVPEETSSMGIVRFAADDCQELLGKKVFFGGKREEIRALGIDLIFMEKANVFAEVEEEKSA